MCNGDAELAILQGVTWMALQYALIVLLWRLTCALPISLPIISIGSGGGADLLFNDEITKHVVPAKRLGQGMQNILPHTASCCSCRPLRRPFTAPPATKQLQSLRQCKKRKAKVCYQHTPNTTRTHHQEQHSQQPIYHIAAEVPRPGAPSAKATSPVPLPYVAAAAGVAITFFALKKIFDTPSRAYKENVGDEYDSWTDDGVLEYYWGEHIHLGYYSGQI